MRWVLLALLVALLTGCGDAANTADARQGEGRREHEPPGQAGPAAVRSRAPSPPLPAAPAVRNEAQKASIPTLSKADIGEARSLLAQDRAFGRIVAGRSYTIARIGPWTTANSRYVPRKTSLELIGAAMEVLLSEPIALSGEPMPMVLYDYSEKNRRRPYQEATFIVDAQRVPQLHVQVDLRRRKVVSISPGPGSSVQSTKAPSGFRRTVPPPPAD